MLSYSKGVEIAHVKKDDKIIKKIYINDVDNLNEDDKTDTNIRNDELLPRSFYTSLRFVTPANMILLKRAIRTNNKSLIPDNKATTDAFESAMEIIRDQASKNIKITDGKIQPIPPNNHWSMAILGASGCGKSHFAGKFMLEYKKKHKDRPIYVFSSITSDDAFKKAKVIYIKIDSSILSDPFMIHEFADSLVVFDDCESLSNELAQAVNKFMDQCLEVGRHHNINTICIKHVIQAGHVNKRLLNESTMTVLYPRTNVAAITKLCKAQYGMTNDDIKDLVAMGKTSRFVLISRNYPSFVLSETQVKVL